MSARLLRWPKVTCWWEPVRSEQRSKASQPAGCGGLKGDVPVRIRGQSIRTSEGMFSEAAADSPKQGWEC